MSMVWESDRQCQRVRGKREFKKRDDSPKPGEARDSCKCEVRRQEAKRERKQEEQLSFPILLLLPLYIQFVKLPHKSLVATSGFQARTAIVFGHLRTALTTTQLRSSLHFPMISSVRPPSASDGIPCMPTASLVFYTATTCQCRIDTLDTMGTKNLVSRHSSLLKHRQT